jgi:hypothetical protein
MWGSTSAASEQVAEPIPKTSVFICVHLRITSFFYGGLKLVGRKQRSAARGCGECRACCVVLGFEARPDESPFTKPAGVACPHVCPTGCAIYDERPPVCRRFQCAWLQTPTLPASLRPDRCGVLFAMNENVLGEGFAVYAYEMRPGAAEREPAAWLLEQVAREATVILVRTDGRREVWSADPAVQERLAGSLDPRDTGEATSR